MVLGPESYPVVSERGKIAYLELGDRFAPTIVVLDGLSVPNRALRALMASLAHRFRLIAPVFASASARLPYTFDRLADDVIDMVDALKLKSYILYTGGLAGPIGFRVFVQRPHQVAGLIVQNASAYAEGVSGAAGRALASLWAGRAAESEATLSSLLNARGGAIDALRSSDSNLPSSSNSFEADLQDRWLDLLENSKTNIALYPVWHLAFREHQPKTLVLWGKNDPFFIPPGARAYLADLPDVRLVWFDSNRFILGEYSSRVVAEICAMFASAARQQKPKDDAHRDLTRISPRGRSCPDMQSLQANLSGADRSGGVDG